MGRWANNLTKGPYLVLFVLLISVGVGTASALVTITLAGNTIVQGTLTADNYFDAGNTQTGTDATAIGGVSNTASGDQSSISGGQFNLASDNSATVGGGGFNTASGLVSTIGGGKSNVANAEDSTIGGGSFNTASGIDSTVAGGDGNLAGGLGSTVGGGFDNTASVADTTVGGGKSNTAGGAASTVGGGFTNTASGSRSTIGGGESNTAIGFVSTVPGGLNNEASGDYSFAAGRQAKAKHHGAFVFADSTPADFPSTAQDQFLVRANGGVILEGGNVGIGTSTPAEKLEVDGNIQLARPGHKTIGIVDQNAGGYDLTMKAGGNVASHGASARGGNLVLEAGDSNRSGPGDTTTPSDNNNVKIIAGDNVFGGVEGTLWNGDIQFFAGHGQPEVMRIVGNTGTVGIGTTSPGFLLHVDGSAGKPGGGSWSVASDQSLKKDIQDIDGALEQISQLHGVKYQYINPENHVSGERIGFLGQEVEKVFPQWVSEIEPQGTDSDLFSNGQKMKVLTLPTDFDALLVEAIKELKVENEKLREALCAAVPEAQICN